MIHNSRRKRFRSVGKAPTKDAIQATNELVTEADFQKAANAQPETAKETREVTSKTRGTKTTRADQKCDTKTTPHPTAAFTQEPTIFPGKRRVESHFSNEIIGQINGWGGIRTHGRLSTSPVFKTGAINRSATHPSCFSPMKTLGSLIYSQTLDQGQNRTFPFLYPFKPLGS